jgi:hypothetical protein
MKKSPSKTSGHVSVDENGNVHERPLTPEEMADLDTIYERMT